MVMPSEYSFVLAGKFGVGKSTLFKRIKTKKTPDNVVSGRTTTRTWGEDEGIDNLLYETSVDGRDVRVSSIALYTVQAIHMS